MAPKIRVRIIASSSLPDVPVRVAEITGQEASGSGRFGVFDKMSGCGDVPERRGVGAGMSQGRAAGIRFIQGVFPGRLIDYLGRGSSQRNLRLSGVGGGALCKRGG